jgi:hypothetical protein
MSIALGRINQLAAGQLVWMKCNTSTGGRYELFLFRHTLEKEDKGNAKRLV